MNNKICSLLEFENRIKNLKNKNNQKIVLCHGVFDVVHPGHLHHFEESKKNGDFLVVSVTTDKFVNKGPGRPIFSLEQRARFIASLSMVDLVVISDAASGVEVINVIKPDVYSKGEEYRVPEDDPSGKMLEEINAVKNVGGTVMFTEGFRSSSSSLINTDSFFVSSEISLWMREFKSKFAIEDVITCLDKVINLNPVILGELIIDQYTDCKALAKSSKDPILAFHRLKSRDFLGGSFAIAHNVSTWTQQAAIFIVSNSIQNSFFENLLKEAQINNLEIHRIEDEKSILIFKHRFVDIQSNSRVFEYYDFNPESFLPETYEKIIQQLKKIELKRSPILVGDYGHGFFDSKLINYLCSTDAFLAINTQSNAGNRGFNTISKYERADFVSLNGGELELEYKVRNPNYEIIVPSIMSRLKSKNAVVTLGADGLLVFDRNGDKIHTPAFANQIVDKVGAGDSVLAIASLLSFTNAPIEIIGLLSSFIAAFEVSQLGHRKSLSLDQIKQSVRKFLG